MKRLVLTAVCFEKSNIYDAPRILKDFQFRANGELKRAMSITAQSWSVTHFLLTCSDGKYRDKYLAYFKLEMAGKGGPEAAKWCFGDLAELNAEYEEYFRGLK